jgi:hypothetical protein
VATGSGQGMGTRINRKKVSMKKKKKRTIIKRSVVEAKGIINNTEIKWISKTNSPESVKFEAVAVAHTTMPIKASLLNLCRAMVKYTAQRLNIDIRDLAQPPPNFNNGRVGFEYFVGYNSTVPVYTLTTIALPTLCGTWDEYAYRCYINWIGR